MMKRLEGKMAVVTGGNSGIALAAPKRLQQKSREWPRRKNKNINEIALSEPARDHRPVCAEIMTMGEREFAAFFRAVAELFGPEQAELAAEDWLQELAAINGLPVAIREWRLITMNVARRLARRLNMPSMEIAVSGGMAL